MRLFCLYLYALLGIASGTLPGPPASASPSPATVLARASSTLAGLTALKYEYRRELHYPSENYHRESVISTYLDFATSNEAVAFRYQADDPESFQVHNGAEQFWLNKNRKTITVNSNPTRGSVEQLSFLYNSPLTLRNSLPTILADASVPKFSTDTVINNIGYHLVRFELKGKVLENISGYRPLTSGATITYQLLIDKATYFPVEVLQTNSLNQDYIKTTFHNPELNPAAPAAASWAITTYRRDYSMEVPEAQKQIAAPTAPGGIWLLPAIASGDSIGPRQFRNQVVLLEFWFSNCGPCISAVPQLNSLYDKFRGQNFQFLAVNVFDSKKEIEQFRQRTQPKYPSLYKGEAVARHYGISYYPGIVLLGKNGAILYQGAFDPKRLEELITKNL